MILESGMLLVKKGQEQAFEKDFKEASKFIRAAKGYKSHQLQKCLEQPNKYLLLVEWENLENHMINFRGSEDYQHWKAMLNHYYDPFPVIEHFEKVFEMN